VNTCGDCDFLDGGHAWWCTTRERDQILAVSPDRRIGRAVETASGRTRESGPRPSADPGPAESDPYVSPWTLAEQDRLAAFFRRAS
jgi:hypothetical protein